MNKNIIVAAMLLIISSIVITSCGNDEPNNKNVPIVKLEELGFGNLKKAYPNYDLHVEGDIEAMNLTQSIQIVVTNKATGYKIVATYVEGKYIGVKNTMFHEHVAIPAIAPLGEYDFALIVADKTGLSTTYKDTITVIAPDGNE